MAKLIPQYKIDKIKTLRSQGWSLPEIYREVKVGYGSVSRYIKGVKILPDYEKVWLSKRNGSKTRKEKAEASANQKARMDIRNLGIKDKTLFMAALYWGEGGKKDFNFTNSDPEMIKLFVSGLREIFGITQENIRVSIRIYDDLDKQECLNYWSKITNIPVGEFVNVDILKGKKVGKLKYGLCRVRIRKGGDMLKYLLALNRRVVELYSSSPRSSTDRTEVS